MSFVIFVRLQQLLFLLRDTGALVRGRHLGELVEAKRAVKLEDR